MALVEKFVLESDATSYVLGDLENFVAEANDRGVSPDAPVAIDFFGSAGLPRFMVDVAATGDDGQQ